MLNNSLFVIIPSFYFPIKCFWMSKMFWSGMCSLDLYIIKEGLAGQKEGGSQSDLYLSFLMVECKWKSYQKCITMNTDKWLHMM